MESVNNEPPTHTHTFVLSAWVQEVEGVLGDLLVGLLGGGVVHHGTVGPKGADGLEGNAHEVILLAPEFR